MLSNKEATARNNITLAQWNVYFEQLFEYIGEPTEQDFINIFEEKPVLDYVDDFCFNSKITEEEIFKSCSGIKQDKAAGPDSSVPGLFINFTEFISIEFSAQ